MELVTGTVVQGKVVVDGHALPEGLVVTLLAPTEHNGFEIPTDLEAELGESLAQAGRAETIPLADVLKRLRAG